MFIRNPSGQIVGVSSSKVEQLLKRGFTLLDEQPKTFEKEKNTGTGLPVYLLTSTDRPDGYGQSQSYLMKYLKKYGIDVSKKESGQNIGMCYYTPVFADRMKTPIKVIYSMFESTTIPSSWVRHLKRADKVIVPSKFCKKSFATRGIETTVVPLGYNHEEYKYIEREKHDVFTFLHYNAFNIRKGFDLVFKAFTQEFSVDEPVRMVFKTIHTKPPFPLLKDQYPNIDVIKAEYNYAQMRNLLSEADAFVFPSRGEGFGLTPLEALATGLPVIIPNGSGMTEYFDPDYFYEVDIKGDCPAVYTNYVPSDVGRMVEPDLESLKKQMRYVYEHQDEARAKGKAGAEWARENWTAEHSAKKLAKVLKEINGEIMPDTKPDVAFLTEDIHFYSGGRYHSWLQALMLAESNLKTVIYTNELPIFRNDFDLYETPEIRLIGHKYPDHLGSDAFNVLDIEANAYFGSPAKASMCALRLGLKYRKPVYITMFDPPTWVENSDVCTKDETDRDLELKAFLDEHLNELVDFKLIVLTENSIDDWAKWYGIDRKYIVALHPAVNSRLVELFDKRTKRARGNHIVMISRNHPRKGFLEALWAFKPFSRDHILHIITNEDNGIMTKLEALGIPFDKVVVHTQVSDIEKFKLLAQSKCVLSASHFEGFGMWATEARAMGIPVVCYDLPAIKDIYNDEGMYKAKCFDKQELQDKLGLAIGSKPLTPKTDHYFEVMQDKLLNIVKPIRNKNEELKITPMFIVLNEEKFIGASLRAVCKRSEVDKVIVVEGADRRYPRADEKGLSVDNTEEEIRKVMEEYPNKIIYEQMGWVSGKEALRQRCIDLADQVGWGLFVDGDEVWGDYYWRKLVKKMRENPNAGVIYFKHLHFWKSLDMIAVGSQWESNLFRCFRFAEKGLEIKQHASEPTLVSGTRIGDKYGRVLDNSIKLHHYGAMKDVEDIKAKLDFYATRDTKLTVKDTWSDWKEGQETQWTAGGGSTERYSGSHPKEIKNICKQ